MDQIYVCQSFQEFVSHCLMDSMAEADLSGMDRERHFPGGPPRARVVFVRPSTPPLCDRSQADWCQLDVDNAPRRSVYAQIMHKCQYLSRVEQFVNNAGGEGGVVIMQAGT